MQAVVINDPELIARIRRLGVLGDERDVILRNLTKEFSNRLSQECQHIEVEHASIWNAIRYETKIDEAIKLQLDVDYIDSGIVMVKEDIKNKNLDELVELFKELI